MNELQRMQYLEAMGIDSYMPRRQLLLGPAMRQCQPVLPAQPAAVSGGDITPVAPVPGSQGEVAAAAGKTGAGAVSVADILGQPATIVTPKPAPVEEALKPAPEAVVVPRFALSLWRVTEQLLVVDSRHAELALPTEALLLNMLNALGLQLRGLPRAEILRWPMVENHFTRQGEAEAREALRAMLEAMHEEQPVTQLLLMGPEACHYLADSPGSSAEQTLETMQGKAVAAAGLGPCAVVLPSLTQMLQAPALKAVAWQALQPFRLR
ncbi:hypothetical protein [Pseudomaricurvus sp. HS19]|uniref:hypothetical protein n=1 Tax=Pseudomaricurvus sp. HS19 TaxID=2692626 RepID=UPI00136A6BF7|nr:hypothetical protein [Pseudomaricurvus sp. HS19]MYM63179.1 hypothetical protein [Pseudomaricurvus sp. HS19]